MEENENLRISACDTVMILFRSSLRFGRCRTDGPWTSYTPGGRKGTFDGRNSCRKCFCVTFDKSNKTAVFGESFLISP